MKRPLPKHQQGLALMIVIFVFALVSVLSVGMYKRQSLFVHAASNIVAQSQAYEYAMGAEIWGRRNLKFYWDEDKEENRFVDDLKEIESSLMVPVDDVLIEGQINDLQGRINLNDLVNLDGTPNKVMGDCFSRLLTRLAINTIKLEAIMDWIDENQQPTGMTGAEDGEYLVADPPYRNAGQPYTDISELLLLPGISMADYQLLQAHVSALPQGRVHINVNTASKEVLQSLTEPGLDDAQVDALVESRDENPWEDIASFKSDPALSGATIKITNLDVYSEFFEIATRISLSDRVARLVSVIYRQKSDGAMQVLRRDQGQKYLITKERMAL